MLVGTSDCTNWGKFETLGSNFSHGKSRGLCWRPSPLQKSIKRNSFKWIMSLTSKQRAFLNSQDTHPQTHYPNWKNGLNDQSKPAFVRHLMPANWSRLLSCKHRWEYPRSSWNLGRRKSVWKQFKKSDASWFCINNQARKKIARFLKKLKKSKNDTPKTVFTEEWRRLT